MTTSASPSGSEASVSQVEPDENLPFLLPDKDPTLHPPAAPKPTASVQEMIAKRRIQRERKARMVRLALTGGIFLMILAGGYFYWISRKAYLPQNDFPSHGSEQAISTASGMIEPHQPLTTGTTRPLYAQRLSKTPWHMASESYEAVEDTPDIKLTSGQFLKKNALTMTYQALLRIRTSRVIEQAIVHLSLVNDVNLIFAKAQIPILLMGGPDTALTKQRVISIAVPMELKNKTAFVASHVEVLRTFAAGVVLNKLMVDKNIKRNQIKLRITAFNPLDTTLKRVLFMIRAVDINQWELGQWKVNWIYPTAARQRVDFSVQLPLSPQWHIRRWEVQAVGEPGIYTSHN